jgi:hypothetical protein
MPMISGASPHEEIMLRDIRYKNWISKFLLPRSDLGLEADWHFVRHNTLKQTCDWWFGPSGRSLLLAPS